MTLHLRDIRLPLRHPFTTAHGTITTQHNLLVELGDGGHTGLGESPFSRAWPQYGPDSARAALETARTCIESCEFNGPEDLWTRVQPWLSAHPFALCALDEAAHDLWGKKQGAPVWTSVGTESPKSCRPPITPSGWKRWKAWWRRLREFDGWPVYKIKLGTADDLAIVRELRRHTGAVLRIDANTAWTVDQTLAMAPELKRARRRVHRAAAAAR